MRPQGAGGIAVSNMPLRLLVRMAYGVQDFQIVGGPSWQMSSKFDITAKAPEGTTKGTQDLLPMMKALLADRFKLKTHTETRELPTYALMVARSDGKLGPDIKPSSSDCSARPMRRSAPRRSPRVAARRIDLDAGQRRDDSVHDHARDQSVQPHRRLRLAWQRAGDERMLTQFLTQVTGRIVHDKTGLTGLYDFELRFDPQVLMAMLPQLGLNIPAPARPPTLPFVRQPGAPDRAAGATRSQARFAARTGRGPGDRQRRDAAARLAR